MRWPYRIGKRVATIKFDVAHNKDVIEKGRIVGRKYGTYDWKYAIQYDNGEIRMQEHDNILSKFKESK